MKKIACLHCGEEALKKDLIAEKFCCVGCQGAYDLVNEMGLSSYYQSRITNEKLRKLKPEESSEMELSSFITKNENTENDEFELLLAIDGLHCAACVWLIENILQKEECVKLVRVNLTKKYLRLKWTGLENRGLELVKLIERIGYKLYPFDAEILAQEEKKYSNELIRKLAVAGFGVGNIMLFSIALWLYDANEMGRQMRNLVNFLMAFIALPCIIYSSSVFFKSAFKALKAKQMNMDITISTAIFLTISISFYQIFDNANHVYFDSSMMLTFFLLIGRYLDFKAKKKAFDVSREFSLLSANFARIIDKNGQIKIMAAKNVKEGMVLLVQSGEKIAADGKIILGETKIDNSLITGESNPVKVRDGSEVFASAINLENAIQVKVTQTQQKSLIKQIQTIIEDSENYKNKFVRIADRVAFYYTPIILTSGLLTFLGWYFLAGLDAQNSMLNAISLLVIACPCALALAVPIAQSLTISMALKNGIVIKSGEVIEKIHKARNFIFDKTGTLTNGKMSVIDFKCLNRKLTKDEKEFYLKLAKSLAQNSSHVKSKAICDFVNFEEKIIQANEKKGLGLEAKINGKIAKLGRKDFVNFDEKLTGEIDEDCSATYLSYDGDVVIFYFNDELKKDAIKFIRELKKIGAELALLSGDEERIVQKIAGKLGVKKYFAKQNPLQKVEILKDLQKNGDLTFVGDGINDAGAMSMANISISFGGASNLTQNVADVIVNQNDLMPILYLIELAKKSLKIIKQNLIFCSIYNFCAIGLAVAGKVNPMVAALAMSGSSLIVILNSLRLTRFKLVNKI